jgi:hypothetical protein
MTGGNTGMISRGWSRIRLGCAAASAVVFALAVIVIGSLTPGYDQWSDAVSRLASPGEPWALAAGIVKYTWGTQVYGISERVLLSLGMCWISMLAARALIASTSDAAAG